MLATTFDNLQFNYHDQATQTSNAEGGESGLRKAEDVVRTKKK